MTDKELLKALKDSPITPGVYIVGDTLPEKSLVIYLGNTPILMLGDAEDFDTVREGKLLAACSLFRNRLRCIDDERIDKEEELRMVIVKTYDLLRVGEAVHGVVRSERGKAEEEGGIGGLVWIIPYQEDDPLGKIASVIVCGLVPEIWDIADPSEGIAEKNETQHEKEEE